MILKIHPHRHHRQPFLRRLRRQLVDFTAVQQHLADAFRLVIHIAGRIVGRNMHPVQPQLAVLRARVGIPQVNLARPDGLDLRAGQRQPGLHPLQNFVIMQRLAIDGNLPIIAHRRPGRRLLLAVAIFPSHNDHTSGELRDRGCRMRAAGFGKYAGSAPATGSYYCTPFRRCWHGWTG